MTKNRSDLLVLARKRPQGVLSRDPSRSRLAAGAVPNGRRGWHNTHARRELSSEGLSLLRRPWTGQRRHRHDLVITTIGPGLLAWESGCVGGRPCEARGLIKIHGVSYGVRIRSTAHASVPESEPRRGRMPGRHWQITQWSLFVLVSRNGGVDRGWPGRWVESLDRARQATLIGHVAYFSFIQAQGVVPVSI